MLRGYARVSTDGQDVAMQVAALRKAGVRSIVEETRSGSLELPGLQALLARLQPGDVLVVWKVDRLARSLRGLLDVADRIRHAGAALRSITEPIDTGTPIGEAFFQLLGVFAQLERALIRQRCEAGRQAARERGVVFGTVSPVTRPVAARLVTEYETLADAVRATGYSRWVIRRGVRRYGLGFRRDGRRWRGAE